MTNPYARQRRLIDLKEGDLVYALLHRLERLYDGFGFVFDEALRADRTGWEYVFIGEVPRIRLGLDPRLKPGDIDVLIIPVRQDRLYVEFAAAIEVKRLPLRGGRIGRNVDRYGITQAEGLLRDGFPLVGVLHVVVADPGDNISDVEIWKVVDADTQRIVKVGNGIADLTGLRAADLQISRLFSRPSSEKIGFNALALQQVGPGEAAFRPYHSRGRPALPNDRQCPKLLDAIRNLAEKVRKDSYVRN